MADQGVPDSRRIGRQLTFSGPSADSPRDAHDEIDRLDRGYAMHFGGHREIEDAVGFGDPTDRQAVIETALAALANCLNAAISMSALQEGVELDELRTTTARRPTRSATFASKSRRTETGSDAVSHADNHPFLRATYRTI